MSDPETPEENTVESQETENLEFEKTDSKKTDAEKLDAEIGEDDKTGPETEAKVETSVKKAVAEVLSTVLWALGIAFVMRTFLFQPFHIPSGSMLPGLMKGDYIITSKYSLGYGKYAATPLPFPVKRGRLFEKHPERGDVLVFRPEGQSKNYIKRLVGLPGDQIQMQKGGLVINGVPTQMSLKGEETFTNQFGRDALARAWVETFENGNDHIIYDVDENGRADNTSVYTVPAGHYFMMGDNRDRSADSRVPVSNNGAGYVPAENLMGKAEFILLSANDDFQLFKPWTWANMRGGRFIKAIK